MNMLSSRWRWIFWLMVLALWTVGLLIPESMKRAPAALLDTSWPYLIAKALHMSVYAGLAAGATWLPGRWLAWIGLLVLHAAAGEWLQTLVPSRTGTLTDVGIDLFGIALGCAAVWWWKKPPAAQ